MIEVTGLTKFYGPQRGIQDVTFRAEEGEVVGLLGPNGAGKTTTIKILTAFYTPSSGSAKVAGYDIVQQHREVRESIGYLPENAPAYGGMTVEGFLAYFLRLKRPAWGGKMRREEIDRVLLAVELTARRRQRIRALSKGLRQRVGLAQALLGDPKVLILDEPTAGLDPRQVQSVRKLIEEEAARGKTILLSTHILREVEVLADRVVILHRGKLVAAGPTMQITADSANLEEAFLTAVSM